MIYILCYNETLPTDDKAVSSILVFVDELYEYYLSISSSEFPRYVFYR